jgi:hypothetical protein
MSTKQPSRSSTDVHLREYSSMANGMPLVISSDLPDTRVEDGAGCNSTDKSRSISQLE